MIDRFEGRLVSTFAALWEERSISRAADRLGYVQSTVTVHLKQLEEQLGFTLFHRSSRGVTPTEAGEKVAPFMYQFMQLARTMEEAIEDRGEVTGTVTVRLLESFYVSEWGEWLSRFLAQYPGIRVRMETGFQQDTVAEVLRQRVDFGIVPMDPGVEELVFEPLLEDELIIAVSPDWGMKWQIEGVSALEGRSMLSFGQRCVYHTIGQQWLQGKSPSLDHMEFPSLDMLKQLLRAGLGAACLPLRSVRQDADEGKLSIIPLKKPIPIVHGIVSHRYRPISAAAARFRESLLQHFRGAAVDKDEEDEEKD